MKKILSFAAVIILCMISTVSAQSFKSGDKIISGSVGFSDKYGMPVGLSYEKGFYDLSETASIGFGGYLGCAFNHDDMSEHEDYDVGTYIYHTFTAALSANYHYTGFRKWDLYGGLRLGYSYTRGTTDWDDDDFSIVLGATHAAKDKSEVAYDLHVGARYYVLRKVAVFAEAGYGISIVSGGLTYKF